MKTYRLHNLNLDLLKKKEFFCQSTNSFTYTFDKRWILFGVTCRSEGMFPDENSSHSSAWWWSDTGHFAMRGLKSCNMIRQTIVMLHFMFWGQVRTANYEQLIFSVVSLEKKQTMSSTKKCCYYFIFMWIPVQFVWIKSMNFVFNLLWRLFWLLSFVWLFFFYPIVLNVDIT